jgi:cell shape-determining protein MreD
MTPIRGGLFLVACYAALAWELTTPPFPWRPNLLCTVLLLMLPGCRPVPGIVLAATTGALMDLGGASRVGLQLALCAAVVRCGLVWWRRPDAVLGPAALATILHGVLHVAVSLAAGHTITAALTPSLPSAAMVTGLTVACTRWWLTAAQEGRWSPFARPATLQNRWRMLTD